MEHNPPLPIPWMDIPFIPDGGHYYDQNPPSYHNPDSDMVPWWRLVCRNCGRRGHTARYFDQPPARDRCIYCGCEGHTIHDCLRRRQMEPHVNMLLARMEEEANQVEEDWDNEPQGNQQVGPVRDNPNWADDYAAEAAGGQELVEEVGAVGGQEIVQPVAANPVVDVGIGNEKKEFNIQIREMLNQIHGLATAVSNLVRN